LQQSRAIETSAVLLADCAFLQQSGMLAIGQEPSSACALTPIAALKRAKISMELVNHFRMLDRIYLAVSLPVKLSPFWQQLLHQSQVPSSPDASSLNVSARKKFNPAVTSRQADEAYRTSATAFRY
jgi:hypothetical protein